MRNPRAGCATLRREAGRGFVFSFQATSIEERTIWNRKV
jgi:hypothetical protein